METRCPFCAPDPGRLLAAEGNCVAIRDGFPVVPGHLLLIPRRHVASFRDLEPAEWQALLALAQRLARAAQAQDPAILGFNFGINDGAAAGQTIPHVHAHLIPRRAGDVPDPRGGVRGVIPGRALYPDMPPCV